MGDKSAIKWTHATWNPVTGCSKVSQGCKNCYAERVFPRAYAGQRVIIPAPSEGLVPYGAIRPASVTGHWTRPRRFTDVLTHADRLDQPLRWKRPRRIFVNSMSDLFHEDVPDAFICQVFAVMESAPQHTFQVLTKRPDRMLRFMGAAGPWVRKVGIDTLGSKWSGSLTWPPSNVWLGVSVEDQETADERIPLLLQTPAAVRWISAEPLLGAIDLTSIQLPPEYNISLTVPGQCNALCSSDDDNFYNCHTQLDWVVAGGESGPGARPMHPQWVRSLRDQCQAYGVPFFFKQWGEFIPLQTATPADRAFEPWSHIFAITPAGNSLHHSLVVDPASITFPTGMYWVDRVGKKASGRKLDGRTWDEYPKTSPI